MAACRAARLTPDASTVADSVARLTLAWLTPATDFRPRSTRSTQEAQVMPSMGSFKDAREAVLMGRISG
jgi:hypothetical protein